MKEWEKNVLRKGVLGLVMLILGKIDLKQKVLLETKRVTSRWYAILLNRKIC